MRLTAEALYATDFVPPKAFPSEGAAVYLSWPPPYDGPGQAASYQVFRSVNGQDFLPLFDRPMTRMQAFDIPASPGRVTYRVRSMQGSWQGPAEQQLDWLPATAPPVPTPPDSTAVTSR